MTEGTSKLGSYLRKKSSNLSVDVQDQLLKIEGFLYSSVIFPEPEACDKCGIPHHKPTIRVDEIHDI
jgi:hypothetical protein